jgi:excisionase family DNA binding protein
VPGNYAQCVDIVVAGLAVFAFAATVLVLTGAGRRLNRTPARVVTDPVGEEWLTVDELAALLEIGPGEVVDLVERGAIPYFVLPGTRSRAAAYRFRRDEIDAWQIG